jgi:hypothetical protein
MPYRALAALVFIVSILYGQNPMRTEPVRVDPPRRPCLACQVID